MKKVLFIGGSGFVGKNTIPLLQKKYEVIFPTRNELNLYSEQDVRKYLTDTYFDVVIHCANPNPAKNNLDCNISMYSGSMDLFKNFYINRDLFGKMLYLGSGAQYNKKLDIINIIEEERYRSCPDDEYGKAKFEISKLIDHSNNIYDLTIFGCYGPYDHDSKFITHCINSILDNKDITVRQDCKFDYLHVYDLARVFEWFIDNQPKEFFYNISGSRHILLSEIAAIVINKMNSNKKIKILKEGLNKEYTSNGNKFFNESNVYPSIAIENGIDIQIKWEKMHKEKE